MYQDEQEASGGGADRPHASLRPRRGRLESIGIGRFSGVVVFVAMFALFALWVPDAFLTSTTWRTIADANAITAILAISLLIPLSAGVYDLSIAQNTGFCAIVCGLLLTGESGFGVVPAILVTLVVGALIGAFNGYLTGFLGLDSFIATLGTLALLQGTASLVTNGEYVGPFPGSFTSITGHSILGLPIVAVYMIVLAVLVWYALEHTPAGRRCAATGANPDAARLAGIQTRRVIFTAMVIAGTGAAVAGVLLGSTLNSVNENMGPQYLLPAFAAAFLGTTQLKLGRFNVWGTVLAVYLLGTGVQGLQLAGAAVWVTNVFNGAALILAVLYARALRQRRKRKEVEAAEA
ncbi:ABC transporter permease [Streptomyces plumbiresistens]|uniref:ABC transporter permease n=1 Tax=Streptomyces plumbiresistens TaxID=511811 RepID=UPI0031ECFE46